MWELKVTSHIVLSCRHGRQRANTTQEQSRIWNEASRFFWNICILFKVYQWIDELVNDSLISLVTSGEFIGGEREKDCTVWWQHYFSEEAMKEETVYGTGERSLWIKHLPCKHQDMILNPQTRIKLSMVVHIHNSSVPMVTWDTETGDSPEAWRTASLGEKNKESITTMWKVRANI